MPPQANISEIFIDSLGNWKIELGFVDYSVDEIDSIRMETSSGSSLITNINLIPGGSAFDSIGIISACDLAYSLTINTSGDYVKITSYAWGDITSEYVAFGNYPGSYLDCINQGESVVFISYIQSQGYTSGFCIDKSPTMGFPNDTTGSLCTFSGHVYDITGNPFTEGFFSINGLQNTYVHIKPDGSFSERIFSRRYSFDTIQIKFGAFPYTIIEYSIEPVDFCLRPDSFHQQDIITTAIVEGIDKQSKEHEIVVTSPNPFTDKISFYFRLEQNQVDDNSLVLYSPDGRVLQQLKLTASQTRLDWTAGESTPSGILTYQLINGKQILDSGKIIRLK